MNKEQITPYFLETILREHTKLSHSKILKLTDLITAHMKEHASKYGLSTPVTDEHLDALSIDLYEELFFMQIKGFTDVKKIVEKWWRKHSVSEQELLNGFCEFLKNDAQIYINGGTLTSYKLYNGKRLRGIELATEYLAALTAHPKQQGEEVESDYLMCECEHISFYHELRKLKCSECDCKAFHPTKNKNV